jgi:hypothetical protein
MAAGFALDVTGRQVVPLFHHINTGGCLLLPLGKKSGKCNTFYLSLPSETGRSIIFNEHKTRNANGDNAQQILIGWSILESCK